MTGEVTLPDTNCGRDTAVEVAKKILRGMSLEFSTLKEEYNYETDHRVDHSRPGCTASASSTGPHTLTVVAKMKRWQQYREFYGHVSGSEPEDPEAKPKAVRVHRFTPV